MVVGMTQMRKRKVVVRQLSALEALGGVTNICSDKTGTLTQGQMVTRRAWIPGVGMYSLTKSNEANNPTQGTISLSEAPASKQEAEQERERKRAEQDQLRSAAALKFDVPPEKEERDKRKQDELRNEKNIANDEEEEAQPAASLPDVIPELQAFLEAAALCNLSKVRYDEEASQWQTMGDPTEIALQVFAHRFSFGKPTLEKEQGWKQLAEYPFDSGIKRMSVIYRRGDSSETVIFTKGAVERIIDLCTSVGYGEHQEPIDETMKAKILDQMDFLAEQGLRVLAIARKDGPSDFQPHMELPREEVESDLTLLGLAGLYDPPRLETKDAVKGSSCFPDCFTYHKYVRC